MAERAPQTLPQALRWFPWPPGDPGPEIYAIIREQLDQRRQLEVAQVLLRTEIAATEARLQGMRDLEKVLSGAGR